MTSGLNVLMVGTGEYTVGLMHKVADNQSDKSLGVLALTLLDLRQRHKIHKLFLCGRSRGKVEQAQAYILSSIEQSQYAGLNGTLDGLFPLQQDSDLAYKEAIKQLPKGSAVIIFTPDETHYPICKFALQHSMHVLVAKPTTLLLKHHQELSKISLENNLLACTEFHKRWDPMYADAKAIIEQSSLFGEMNYFYSYMSQPKYQLHTFKQWAGKSSDISYYLNAHHIDFLMNAIRESFMPHFVSAVGSRGLSSQLEAGIPQETEDTITLLVELHHKSKPLISTAVFTSSWVAPNQSEVHSQQYFHCLGSQSEIRVNQGHRGYSLTSDLQGFKMRNPLFMRYLKNEEGQVGARQTYGYRSIQLFCEASQALNQQKCHLSDWLLGDKRFPKVPYGESDGWGQLALFQQTEVVTAILEAGRRSLDQQGKRIRISYDQNEYQLE